VRREATKPAATKIPQALPKQPINPADPSSQMNQLIVQMGRQHADDLADGILPIILAGSKRDLTARVFDVRFDLDRLADSMHGDPDGKVADPFAQSHRPFQPRVHLPPL
jgi:hypothetical protein